MVIINFLIFLLKVLGLIFVVGIVLNLILDVVIIGPIQNRMADRKKLQILDAILNKLELGEEITEEDVESLEKEIEK